MSHAKLGKSYSTVPVVCTVEAVVSAIISTTYCNKKNKKCQICICIYIYIYILGNVGNKVCF